MFMYVWDVCVCVCLCVRVCVCVCCVWVYVCFVCEFLMSVLYVSIIGVQEPNGTGQILKIIMQISLNGQIRCKLVET